MESDSYAASRPIAGVRQQLAAAATGARDWLDARGKGAWIVAMILGFIAFWPAGLAILGYMIWSKRMFACSSQRRRFSSRSSGNTAFDAYREQVLRRLEDEQREFQDFLTKLREAKDKAEFDQFMESRREH